MIKSYKNIKVLFFVFALLISAIIYITILSSFYPYKIAITAQMEFDKNYYQIYHDFDKDGKSERIQPYTQILTGISYLNLFDSTEVNFGSYKFDRKIQKAFEVFFADYNSDGIDEIIFFTLNLDTLFVSVLNAKTELVFIDEEPVLIREPILNKDWDLSRIEAKLYDFDDDKRPELILYVATTHSVPIRGLVIYDFEEKRILNKFISPKYFENFYLEDLNSDDNVEILVSSVSPGNFDKNLKNNDWETKFFVFDKKLNPIYESDVLNIYPSSARTIILKDGNSKTISVTNIQNKSRYPPKTFVYNEDLDIIKILTFPKESIDVIPFYFKINSQDHIFYLILYDDFSEIQLYSNKYELIKTKRFDKKLNIIIKQIDIEDDQTNEIIGFQDKNIFIMDHNFEFLSFDYIRSALFFSNNYFSIGRDKEKVLFLLKDETTQSYAELQKSAVHKYSILIGLLSIPIFYFVFIFVNTAYLRIKKYSDSLQYLINQPNNNVLIINHSGKLLAINPIVLNKINPNKHIKKGDNLFENLDKNSTLFKMLKDNLDSKNDSTRSNIIYNENGITEGEIFITPLKSIWGYVYAYLIRLEDRTKVIQHERSLIWAKTAQKIAHDIKTPLSIIQLNLSSLKSRIEVEFLNKKIDYFSDIEMIQDEIKRISKLTKDFLKFSNLERPNFQSVSIKEELERATNHYTSYLKNGVKIEINISDEANLIWGDPNQIEQLFHIFIENAIDAVNGVGIIKINTEETSLRNDDVKKYITISIRDNGEGINEEYANKIFQPYFTTKIEGSGLGLAIAKKIISDNNGVIQLESAKGIETTFKIIFPKFIL